MRFVYDITSGVSCVCVRLTKTMGNSYGKVKEPGSFRRSQGHAFKITFTVARYDPSFGGTYLEERSSKFTAGRRRIVETGAGTGAFVVYEDVHTVSKKWPRAHEGMTEYSYVVIPVEDPEGRRHLCAGIDSLDVSHYRGGYRNHLDDLPAGSRQCGLGDVAWSGFSEVYLLLCQEAGDTILNLYTLEHAGMDAGTPAGMGTGMDAGGDAGGTDTEGDAVVADIQQMATAVSDVVNSRLHLSRRRIVEVVLILKYVTEGLNPQDASSLPDADSVHVVVGELLRKHVTTDELARFLRVSANDVTTWCDTGRPYSVTRNAREWILGTIALKDSPLLYTLVDRSVAVVEGITSCKSDTEALSCSQAQS